MATPFVREMRSFPKSCVRACGRAVVYPLGVLAAGLALGTAATLRT